jgi:2-polyprenyl-6-hydroxyphenyl methylase/3-demethylubiquinone-9 3-methyltransferase
MNATEAASRAPNVDPAELAKFSALAHRWWDPDSELFGPLHKLNPLRLDWIERVAGGLAGKAVLDVGCGGGILAEGMAGRGARVLGIDLSEKALSVAKLHKLESGTSVDYRLVAAEALAAEATEGFEIVTCMEMLEHVPDPAAIVDALATMVRPGGHVFLSTINRTPRAYALAIVGAEYVLRLLPPGTHTYEKFIRPSELAAWAKAAGLTLADVSGLDYDPFTRRAALKSNASVNYLMHVRRPAQPST